MNLKSFKLGLFTGVFALVAFSANAQQPKQAEHSNANVRMGQKALLDGDFKNAESYLTKPYLRKGKIRMYYTCWDILNFKMVTIKNQRRLLEKWLH